MGDAPSRSLSREDLVHGRQWPSREAEPETKPALRDPPEPVQTLHPGAFASFICLWARYQDEVDPRLGRPPTEPLSEKERKRMIQKAFAAYNHAMQTDRFGLALSIALRFLPRLPKVDGVSQSAEAVRERQEDAAVAFADARRAFMKARGTLADAEFMQDDLARMRSEFPVLRWRDAALEGRWEEACRLAESGAVTRRHLHESVRGLHHQYVADGRVANALALERRHSFLAER